MSNKELAKEMMYWRKHITVKPAVNKTLEIDDEEIDMENTINDVEENIDQNSNFEEE